MSIRVFDWSLGRMVEVPLCIDLYCGLGGWADGFLAEGWAVAGFDIERHAYPRPTAVPVDEGGNKLPGNNSPRRWSDRKVARLKDATKGIPLLEECDSYPAQLILQDVRTIHGSQFRSADCIVASPPCQEYSYMAMPWTRAKQIGRALRYGHGRFPAGYVKSRTKEQLNELFNACFRIQREASEAAGRHIPLIVENVKGAQKWVGDAAAHYGSFYLWGDVPALMPSTMALKQPGRNFHFPEKYGIPSPSFHGAAHEPSVRNALATKNNGGSWFAVAHNTGSGHIQNPVTGEGQKAPVYSDPRRNGGRGVHLTNPHENLNGVKQAGHSGRAWFADPDVAGHFSSKSLSRKAASAQIAKIPLPLAQHIARVFKPV